MSESAVPLYVVVREGVGSHASAVFTSEGKAEKYIELGHLTDASAEPHHVQGGYEPGLPVFAAEEYDEVLEVRHFIGLYADEAGARRDAGRMGHVVRMVPDEHAAPSHG